MKDKLSSFGTTIFTVMSALAQKHNAINVSQGFPDFNCDNQLIELCHKYFSSNFHQYAPMPGIIELRETVSKIIQTCYNKKTNPETEITITAGATQGIYTAISAFINKGDEVILFEPAYDCYAPAILVNGGIPIYCKLNSSDFSINWNEVASKISPKTKMIIINSPHNPTGTVINKTDVENLILLTKNTDIIILSDEVYEHIIFDGLTHESVLRYEELFQKSIMISSFGKTIHTTGWKIGYVAAPEHLMKVFRKVHQFLVFAVNHPLQRVISEYLQNKENYLGIKVFYQQKRDYFVNLIKGSAFEIMPSQGTYFVLLKYNHISMLKDTDFTIELTEKYKLATIPLSAFYHNNEDNKLIRICFAKKDETLLKASQIINLLN